MNIAVLAIMATMIGVYEILMVTPEIQQALINHLDYLKLIDIAQHQGNMTLLTAGLTLVDQGITTITEIKRVIGMISEVEIHQ